MKALLIVDLQYDFLPGGNLAVAQGDEIIPVINKIQKDFDLVIATQDWHPANHKSFASQHPDSNTFDLINLNGILQVLWPDHCIQGTRGAEFTAEWDSTKVAAVFRKGMNVEVDSYSGFYDNDHQHSTGLLGFLNDKSVTELYVCGLAAEFCVYFSAKDAQEAGIKTFFLNFATKPITEEGLIKVQREMATLGITILNHQEELN
ncbi:bifunctional nicotinamidase/pyrazinamidase [Myroides odoratimimus]|uniref:bifunctional nicotinamidase/pyrazinamidase n=1 Tax=Myroides odoratimimus TaxID=76832 RepID=UPI00257813EF|nr:bifunctional nicotinamidase/pyrazinamidase [Myroides odoratimimus]MDM1098102.1 bifunctional nicotinamidase/pyrazinamidase [Myroides odoratimimus]MDM1328271.1 bifunctional nicotinamidase/pyrazinamidase [Myroides odoratimimus]MDM1445014.1 bifunctional nicotinamidase/pyrazinamidase [Myroides odoratimimus]MDM1451274.1 bifunctional nicotinamidase/pyrazinamidase [Myroides odoratimimus]MDM1454430.1 bifunctional nicotinamidase/pyrazinamidase [Myroides odoratimimus]